MKRILAAALVLASFTATAADITLSVPDAQVNRVRAAVGKIQSLTDASGNPRPATLAETRAWVITIVRGALRQQELTEARNIVTVTDVDIQ